MKYLRQFLLIYLLFRRVVKILPAIADTGKYLWYGDFIYRIAQWNHQTRCGEGCREIPDRDHAGHVYTGRGWSDGIMGYIETGVSTGQCDHGCSTRCGYGCNRTCIPMCDQEIQSKRKGKGAGDMKDLFQTSMFAGVTLSLLAYLAGLLLKKKFKLGIFNPLLISIILTIIVLVCAHIDYDTYNKGAVYLSWFLTPATVCLAIPLYEQWQLLKRNVKAVMLGITAGVLTSLTTVFVLSKLMGLTHQEYVTMLPKSITTAIGMGVSEELGGYVTITVAVIVVTGVIGNILGEFICKLFRITEPISKGLALGSSSHAIGTAKAIEMGEVEGAMSSLAIAVTGILTVVLASVYANFM